MGPYPVTQARPQAMVIDGDDAQEGPSSRDKGKGREHSPTADRIARLQSGIQALFHTLDEELAGQPQSRHRTREMLDALWNKTASPADIMVAMEVDNQAPPETPHMGPAIQPTRDNLSADQISRLAKLKQEHARYQQAYTITTFGIKKLGLCNLERACTQYVAGAYDKYCDRCEHVMERTRKLLTDVQALFTLDEKYVKQYNTICRNSI